MVEETEEKIKEIAVMAADWTDDDFAHRLVTLLIHDKGSLNKYKRTMDFTIKVCRERDILLQAKNEDLQRYLKYHSRCLPECLGFNSVDHILREIEDRLKPGGVNDR